MTKYLQKTFSVSAPAGRQYAENWERTFGQKTEPEPEPEGRAWECSRCSTVNIPARLTSCDSCGAPRVGG